MTATMAEQQQQQEQLQQEQEEEELTRAYAPAEGADAVDADEAARKRDALDARWQQKLAQRQAAQQERQQAKALEEDPSQDVDAFQRRFRELAAAVAAQIDGARVASESEDGISRTDLARTLDEAVQRVNGMQSALAAATLFLPAYDVRLCTERIAQASADIETARTTLAPRRKFAFGKGKSGKSSKSSSEAKSEAASKAAQASAESSSRANAVMQLLQQDSTELVFADRAGEEMDVAVSSGDQDVRLSDMTDCTVRISAQTGAVRFLRLTRCRLLVGPVAGSCFFEKCEDCVFVVASRQVRIHDSARCDFYLHVLSRPIIEHCAALRFAPYRLMYAALPAQLAAAKLDVPRAQDMWKDVDDFRWLREQQSPNWSIMPEEARSDMIHI